MIEWLSLSLKESFDIFLYIGLLFAFFSKMRIKAYVRTAVSMLAVFFAVGYLLAGGILIFASESLLQEANVESVSIFSGIILIALLFAILRSVAKYEDSGSPRRVFFIFLLVVAGFNLLPKFLYFAKLLQRLAFQASMFNTGILYQVFGFFMGVILSAVIARAVYKLAPRIDPRWLLASLLLIILSAVAGSGVSATRVYALHNLISLQGNQMTLLLNLISFQPRIEYMYYGVTLMLAVIALTSRGNYSWPEALNPAMLRKQKSGNRSYLRWSGVFILTSLLMYGIFAIENVMADKKDVLISESKKVTANNGIVSIKTKEIDDGELHRFSYKSNGVSVKFILIYKGSGIFGVALDACQICGPAGFYKKDDNVICSECDSVISKSTVGFQGGCNPLPLNHNIAKGYVEIKGSDLDAASKHFEGGSLK